MATMSADVLRTVNPELRRKLGSVSAPINIVVRNQNAINAGVRRNVLWIGASVFKGMV